MRNRGLASPCLAAEEKNATRIICAVNPLGNLVDDLDACLIQTLAASDQTGASNLLELL